MSSAREEAKARHRLELERIVGAKSPEEILVHVQRIVHALDRFENLNPVLTKAGHGWIDLARREAEIIITPGRTPP